MIIIFSLSKWSAQKMAASNQVPYLVSICSGGKGTFGMASLDISTRWGAFKKTFFKLFTSVLIFGNNSLTFSAILWIMCARHVTCIMLGKNTFNVSPALIIYGAASDNNSKTFSSLTPLGHKILKPSLTKREIVEWFVFSSF